MQSISVPVTDREAGTVALDLNASLGDKSVLDEPELMNMMQEGNNFRASMDIKSALENINEQKGVSRDHAGLQTQTQDRSDTVLQLGV